MNLAPQNMQQVALCYTLLIIFLAKLEMIYVFTNLQNSTFIEILVNSSTFIHCGLHLLSSSNGLE